MPSEGVLNAGLRGRAYKRDLKIYTREEEGLIRGSSDMSNAFIPEGDLVSDPELAGTRSLFSRGLLHFYAAMNNRDHLNPAKHRGHERCFRAEK